MERIYYLKDGRSYQNYERRTKNEYMDSMAMLAAQERDSDKYGANKQPVVVSNKLFNKMYWKKHKEWQRRQKRGYNRLMNETLKTSNPPYALDQSFNTNTLSATDRADCNGRLSFKLDPSFTSISSVYKTIALRSIYMNPNSYQAKFDCNVLKSVNGSVTTTPDDDIPVTDMEVEYTRHTYRQKDRIETAKFIITRSSGVSNEEVIITQDYKYTGDADQSTTISEITVNTETLDGDELYGTMAGDTFTYDDSDGTYTYDITIKAVAWGQYVKTTDKKFNSSLISTIREEIELNDEYVGDGAFTTTIKTTTYTSFTNITIPISTTLLPENDIEVFAYNVVNQFKTGCEANAESNVQQYYMDYEFNNANKQLTFTINTTNDDNISFKFTPTNNQTTEQFKSLFYILNQPPDSITTDTEYATSITYINVWNRRDMFIHASYMNTTPYNLLGRANEQYSKPVKLTRYSTQTPDVDVWTSTDGMTPYTFYYQSFEVNLVLAATLTNCDIIF